MVTNAETGCYYCEAGELICSAYEGYSQAICSASANSANESLGWPCVATTTEAPTTTEEPTTEGPTTTEDPALSSTTEGPSGPPQETTTDNPAQGPQD